MLQSLLPIRLRPSLMILGIALFVGLLAPGGAGAVASEDQGNGTYLALGDSVVFGYIAGDGFAYTRPNNFVGYPDYVGRALNLDPVNASCPGEASGGFQLAAPAGNDNGCRSFKAHFPLHVSYAGAATQMAFATQYLKTHSDTKLVTLGLGANDAFILQRTCTTQACLIAGLQAMSANIDAILGGIRATGYQGVLEVVNYYSLDYGDPASVQGAQLLNAFETASAAAHHAFIADAFTAMQTAASAAGGHTCQAGLLNVGTPFVSCDVHPSQAGQQTLAQAVVDAYLAATGDNQS